MMKKYINLFLLIFLILLEAPLCSCDSKSNKNDIDLTGKHVVSFYNYDHRYITTIVVNDSEDAIYSGNAPVKPADDEFTYTFIGWNQDTTNVTCDLEVEAVFMPVARNNWGEIHW